MGLDGACDSGTSSSDEDDGYKSDAEEEMMEVERSPPLSDEGRIPGSVPEPSGLRYGKGPHTLPPLTFQAVSPPVSPTNTREMELVPTIPAHQEQQVTALCQPTPTSPGLSRQVRFVMPSARKVGSNNPGGVLENGLAKMKFANAGTIKKHGGFNGVMEGRRVS
jgi:ADA HAT complex component 1